MIDTLRVLCNQYNLMFILGLSLFFIIFGTFFNITEASNLFQDEIRPFTIYTTNITIPQYFIGCVMIENSQDAIMMINEWGQPDAQSDFIIRLSEPADSPQIAIKRRYTKLGMSERVVEFSEMRLVPYSDMPYLKNLTPDPYTLLIRPSEINNYYGVEFKQRNVSRQVSPYQISLSVPLKIFTPEMVPGYHEVQTLLMQVVPPKDYEVSFAMPEPVLFRLIGKKFSTYQFIVDTTRTDLFILFENRFIERELRIIEIILGMLLSLSIYLMAEGFINIAAPLKEFIFDKEKKGFLLEYSSSGQHWWRKGFRR